MNFPSAGLIGQGRPRPRSGGRDGLCLFRWRAGRRRVLSKGLPVPAHHRTGEEVSRASITAHEGRWSAAGTWRKRGAHGKHGQRKRKGAGRVIGHSATHATQQGAMSFQHREQAPQSSGSAYWKRSISNARLQLRYNTYAAAGASGRSKPRPGYGNRPTPLRATCTVLISGPDRLSPYQACLRRCPGTEP